jgi:hypothetical protein
MQYFFGENWRDTINATKGEINKGAIFVTYNNTEKNITIFGFRGFSSGSELAIQIEMIASEYVIPILQDMFPFYNVLTSRFLEFYVELFHNFGSYFFDPVSMAKAYLDPIKEEYERMDHDEVMFTGINIGGLFAKTLGMLTHHQGVSFISFPVFNAYFKTAFHFTQEESVFVTNVFNYEGTFTHSEPDLATNIGLPTLEASLVEKDTVYRTFCILSEVCGYGEKFGDYCISQIGEEELASIRDQLHNNYQKK